MKPDKTDESPPKDEHIVHLPEPFKFEIGADYDYLRRGTLKTLGYCTGKFLADIVINVFARACFGLKVEGLKNLTQIKGGAVVLCNHVHPCDCTFIDIMLPLKRVYYVTLESNFKIPVARHLMRNLGGIPLPKNVGKMRRFKKAVDDALQNGDIVCIYPEGVLYPYYAQGLREFRDGAFRIAADNNVPIVPMVITFREPKGAYRLYKAYPCVTLSVLPPVYPKENEKLPAKKLKEECYKAMSDRVSP